jgi:glyoxylase-like metal-dependent hydrolase (beta-lactamase superfamily II)
MLVNKLVLGEYENNCYVVQHENSSNCLIIDTGLDAMPLVDFLQKNNLNPVALVLTHGHVDHIAGVDLIREKYKNIKVYVHKADAEMLGNSQKNFANMLGKSITASPADVLLEKEGETDFEGFKFVVYHTPGHTAGSMSFVWRDNLFTGDTLLIDGCGRTDFQSGSAESLYDSVTTRLFGLADQMLVWPGHDYKGRSVSTIGWEKRHNARLAGRGKQDFVELMRNLDLPKPKMIDVAVPANQNLGLPHGA